MAHPSGSDELCTAVQRLQEELASSHANLLPLADHVQSSYAACQGAGKAEQRMEAFRTARGYVTQALASVAYQVNEGASLLEQLLATEEAQLRVLDAAMRQPRQQFELHNEHLGRRAIAAMTVQRKNVKARKVTKVAGDPLPAVYVRKPLVFDALDAVGSGVATVDDQHARVQALQKSNERRFSNAVYYAPQRRAAAEPTVGLVEDIYGSVAPLAGKVKVSLPTAPPSAIRTGGLGVGAGAGGAGAAAQSSSLYGSIPVAPPTAPTLPKLPPGMPAAPPPPPPSTAHASAGAAARVSVGGVKMELPADNVYEDPSSGFYANAEPLAAKLPPVMPPAALPSNASASLVLPPPPPPPTTLASGHSKAVALYDYQATQPDELTFFENEVIEIVARNNDGWFEGTIGDRRGLFPGNFVQEMEESES